MKTIIATTVLLATASVLVAQYPPKDEPAHRTMLTQDQIQGRRTSRPSQGRPVRGDRGRHQGEGPLHLSAQDAGRLPGQGTSIRWMNTSP